MKVFIHHFWIYLKSTADWSLWVSVLFYDKTRSVLPMYSKAARTPQQEYNHGHLHTCPTQHTVGNILLWPQVMNPFWDTADLIHQVGKVAVYTIRNSAIVESVLGSRLITAQLEKPQTKLLPLLTTRVQNTKQSSEFRCALSLLESWPYFWPGGTCLGVIDTAFLGVLEPGSQLS